MSDKKTMSTIYLDMDGVVADFEGYAEAVVGHRPKRGHRYSTDDWFKICVDERIYSKLELMPDAVKLVDELKKIANDKEMNLAFLSAVPRENNMQWVFWDKTHWIKKRFPGIPLFLGPYTVDKKSHHKQENDVLIDDRISNIEEWESVGGKAILYKDDVADTLRQLRRMLG